MPSKLIMNHYEIIEEIGRGAMGIVYKAKDIKLDRIVALKELLLAPHVNSQEKQQMVDRFYREARSAGKLSHPNIVTIYDVGEEDERYFIAMEFLAGQSLANMLEQGVVPDTEQAINIICQVGEALDCAHRESIVHRDIKPANIMTTIDGRVKVADFGIARVASSSAMTQTGSIIGSPGYMSPEQITGRKVDGRADIFSLGIILYQLMTGEKPFAGDTITTIIYKIVNQEPVPPRSVNIQISQHIEQIILRALAKDPAMRYQTVREMVEDLRNPEKAANWAQAAVQQTPEQTVFIGTSSSSTQIPIHQETPQISYKEPEKAKKIFPVFAGIAGILVVVIGLSMWMLTKQNDSNSKTFPPTLPPKQISENDVKTTLNRWLIAQNNRDFTTYTNCYDPSFNGIKRTVSGKVYRHNYNDWLMEQSKMIRGAKSLLINIKNVVISINLKSNTATATFIQYYQSDGYSDKGEKTIRFNKLRGITKIAYEEFNISKPDSSQVSTTKPPITQLPIHTKPSTQVIQQPKAPNASKHPTPQNSQLPPKGTVNGNIKDSNSIPTKEENESTTGNNEILPSSQTEQEVVSPTTEKDTDLEESMEKKNDKKKNNTNEEDEDLEEPFHK